MEKKKTKYPWRDAFPGLFTPQFGQLVKRFRDGDDKSIGWTMEALLGRVAFVEGHDSHERNLPDCRLALQEVELIDAVLKVIREEPPDTKRWRKLKGCWVLASMAQAAVGLNGAAVRKMYEHEGMVVSSEVEGSVQHRKTLTTNYTFPPPSCTLPL
jgi:hypothetical protein